MSSLAPPHPGLSRLWPLRRIRFGRPRGVTLGLLVLIALAPPAYLMQTGGALAAGYNIQRLQAERSAWRVRNEQLQLELAKARSLAWIESEAANRLGMLKATNQTVVRVDVAPPPSAGARTASQAGTLSAGQAQPGPSPTNDRPATSWLERLATFLTQVTAWR